MRCRTSWLDSRQGLKRFRITEGQNAKIEFRWAEGQYERLGAFADDLVRSKVAVFVTGGGEAPALAAKAATSSIPIIFNVGTDPVAAGLVASLARPGGSATGVNILSNELAGKRLGLSGRARCQNLQSSLISSIPTSHRPKPWSKTWTRQPASRGGTIVRLEARSESEIDTAFASDGATAARRANRRLRCYFCIRGANRSCCGSRVSAFQRFSSNASSWWPED